MGHREQAGPIEERDERAIRALYGELLDAWNQCSPDRMAAVFAEDGDVVGFDGSLNSGRAGIASEMGRIFADHATGAYVGRVRDVRPLATGAAILRAVAGTVPAGRTELEPRLNVVQTLVAVRRDGRWCIERFQNTPAQFHGRPDLSESLTEELRQELSATSPAR